MVMNVKALFRLIEKSNLPPEAKSRLRAKLQEALDDYMMGKISQDALTGIVTDILRQLNVNMSTPVRRLRRIRDKPAPSDEVVEAEDKVVESKDEVVEEDYYIGQRRVRRYGFGK
jgi:hypothetical protein